MLVNQEHSGTVLGLAASVTSLAWLSYTQYGHLYVSLAPPLSACRPVSLSVKTRYEHTSVRHTLSPAPQRKLSESSSLWQSFFLQADSRRHVNRDNYMHFNTWLPLAPQTLSPTVRPALPSDARILWDGGRLAQGHQNGALRGELSAGWLHVHAAARPHHHRVSEDNTPSSQIDFISQIY